MSQQPLRFRRTLAEARRAFEEDVLPGLSDYQANQGRTLLQEAETKAQQRADAYTTEQEQGIQEARDQALRTLTDVRDEYEALTAEGNQGRMSAQDYQARLRELRHEQENAEALLARADELVDRIEEIEADPIRWYDDLTRRMNMLQEWPW